MQHRRCGNCCFLIKVFSKNVDVAITSEIDQLSAKLLKDGAPLRAIHVANINLSTKLDTFPVKCKIAEIKPSCRKGIKTEAKNNRPFSLLCLISKLTEKSIIDQTQDHVKEMNCCRFTNQALEQNIPQIHVCLG